MAKVRRFLTCDELGGECEWRYVSCNGGCGDALCPLLIEVEEECDVEEETRDSSEPQVSSNPQQGA